MDITPYTSFFHDGEILAIAHRENDIEIVMKSAEVDPEAVRDIPLSSGNRFVGKLHVNGIKMILNNGIEFKQKVKMFFSDNDLLHLKIIENIVFLEIGWRGSNPGEVDFSDFEIHAAKVWWENLPNLVV